jgi:hypothetical protein
MRRVGVPDPDDRRWIVPVRATEALRAVLPQLTALAAEAESRAAAHTGSGTLSAQNSLRVARGCTQS